MSTPDLIAAAAERHAEAILRASGSSLRNYTMPATRRAILAAVLDCYEEAYCDGRGLCGRTGESSMTDPKSIEPTQADMAYAKSIVEAVEHGCTYEDRCLAVRDLLARHRLASAPAAPAQPAADLVEALRNIRALAAKRQAEGRPDGCLTDIEGFARAALSRYAKGGA